MAGVTALSSASIFLQILTSYDTDVIWWWGTAMSLVAVGLLLLVLALAVGWWSGFDFAVPHRLRTPTDTPETWADARTLIDGNRQERRAKRQGRG